MKEIINTHEWLFRVHCNAVTSIIITEVTLPRFGTIWYDGRCILDILSLLKAKNKYRIMYNSTEGNQSDILSKILKNNLF